MSRRQGQRTLSKLSSDVVQSALQSKKGVKKTQARVSLKQVDVLHDDDDDDAVLRSLQSDPTTSRNGSPVGGMYSPWASPFASPFGSTSASPVGGASDAGTDSEGSSGGAAVRGTIEAVNAKLGVLNLDKLNTEGQEGSSSSSSGGGGGGGGGGGSVLQHLHARHSQSHSERLLAERQMAAFEEELLKERKGVVRFAVHQEEATGTNDEGQFVCDIQSLFLALDVEGKGTVSLRSIIRVLQQAGLKWMNDPRLSSLRSRILHFNSLDTELSPQQFSELIDRQWLFARAFTGHLVIPNIASFAHTLQDIYDKTKAMKLEGDVAQYVKSLSTKDPSKFAVSVCTVDGQRFSLGDAEEPFSLQACFTPFLYCAVLDQLGRRKTHKHVGHDPAPAGKLFELNANQLPHNPLINSGALMMCSMYKPQLRTSQRYSDMVTLLQRLAGNSKIGFDNALFLEEYANNSRSSCLAYMLEEAGAFPRGTDINSTLELYFQCCALEVSTPDVAVMAATLANSGTCPLTNTKLFKSTHVRDCLSMMLTCGMYDYSGEWAYSIGIPAKAGASGCVFVVVPRVMGICIYSPVLVSERANSARAVQFCEGLVEQFQLHQYDSVLSSSNTLKVDPTVTVYERTHFYSMQLLFAALEDDVPEMRRLLSTGVNVNCIDYDMRTPLHNATMAGNKRAVKFLLRRGANALATDRWGRTPLDEAQDHNQSVIHTLLKEHVDRSQDKDSQQRVINSRSNSISGRGMVPSLSTSDSTLSAMGIRDQHELDTWHYKHKTTTAGDSSSSSSSSSKAQARVQAASHSSARPTPPRQLARNTSYGRRRNQQQQQQQQEQ